VVGLTAPDPSALARAVGEYPATEAVRTDGRDVVAELRDDDLASLNRFLAARGIWVSHLARRRRSLEDAFMELTGTSGTMHELAAPAAEGVA